MSDGRTEERIALCEPFIGGNEWAYVKECLDTGWVSSVGSYVDRFEREIAAAVGRAHAVATISGTAALHVALEVAGVRPDDEVLVSDLTFIAPANAIRYLGAHPVLIDAEPEHWQMDAELLGSFLKRSCVWRNGELRNSATDRRVAAILPVHVLGHPVDLDAIIEVAEGYGLPLIEDATEALGATYRGAQVGSRGDLACLSFNGNKLITTGGGGMLVTDDPALADRARYLTTQAKDDPVAFVHGVVGYNYRLSNVAAAMGCAQLEQMPSFLARKREIANRYAEGLAGSAMQLMRVARWAQPAWWLSTVTTEDGNGRALRDLNDRGIMARPLWQPLHESPAHREALAVGGGTATEIVRKAVSLPSSVGLTAEQQDRVIETLLATEDS